VSDDDALRIVRGTPTPEELAVVTAVIAAASNPDGAAAHARRRGRWNDPATRHRRPWRPGPGAWQASAR
jgi:hypothetical protein